MGLARSIRAKSHLLANKHVTIAVVAKVDRLARESRLGVTRLVLQQFDQFAVWSAEESHAHRPGFLRYVV